MRPNHNNLIVINVPFINLLHSNYNIWAGFYDLVDLLWDIYECTSIKCYNQAVLWPNIYIHFLWLVRLVFWRCNTSNWNWSVHASYLFALAANYDLVFGWMCLRDHVLIYGHSIDEHANAVLNADFQCVAASNHRRWSLHIRKHDFCLLKLRWNDNNNENWCRKINFQCSHTANATQLCNVLFFSSFTRHEVNYFRINVGVQRFRKITIDTSSMWKHAIISHAKCDIVCALVTKCWIEHTRISIHMEMWQNVALIFNNTHFECYVWMLSA